MQYVVLIDVLYLIDKGVLKMTYNFNADKFSKPEIYTRKNTSLVHILFEDDEIIGVYQDRLLAEKDAKQMHLIDWHIMARQFQ